MATYDEVVRRFGDADTPALREPVARALSNKGARLAKLDRQDDASAAGQPRTGA